MLPPRAYIFIFLNAVRVLSIIVLLLVFASNIVTLSHDIQAVNRFSDPPSSTSNLTTSSSDNYIEGSTVPNQPAGIFWAILNRLFIIGQVAVLSLSEVGWPASFFDRYFPVLGNKFGLGALGIIQCLIGAAILSYRVDTFTLVSAFFLFAIGCLNMLIGLIWRKSAKTKRSIMGWRDHAKDTAKSKIAGVQNVAAHANHAATIVFGNQSNNEDVTNLASGHPIKSWKFEKQGEKAAAMKGYLISKPLRVLSFRPSARS